MADPSPYLAKEPNPYKNVLESSILSQTVKVLRKLPNFSCYFVVAYVKDLDPLFRHVGSGSAAKLLCRSMFWFGLPQYVLSVISAIVAEFVTYPLDLTKTRLQIQVVTSRCIS
jgi:hypothetical protein